MAVGRLLRSLSLSGNEWVSGIGSLSLLGEILIGMKRKWDYGVR